MEAKLNVENAGVVIGYLTSYVIFTLILYLVLSFVHKLPVDWSILSIGLVTASVALLGVFMGWLLK